ncbi:MAG: hypothetical protein WB689_17260, partial [Xanthobacteraceae bacterium]
MAGKGKSRAALWPGLAALAAATVYLTALLAVERQALIISLMGVGIAAVTFIAWFRLFDGLSHSFVENEDPLGACAILAVIAIAACFHDDHFAMLLIVTVLLYSVATLGLNIQFGYAGVLNFAGASFFGVGAYTSAVLGTYTAVPHLI